MKRVTMRVGLVAVLLALSGCTSRSRPSERTWMSMGTFASVAVPASEQERLPELCRVARQTFQELQDALTVYDERSEISRMNAQAGGSEVDLSAATHEVLVLAIHYATLSGGAFDPTVAPLVRLWGFNTGEAPETMPSGLALEEMRARVGYTNVWTSAGGGRPAGAVRRARLERRGMEVDLGGIAKGYAVDVCYDRFLAMGVSNVMINLGGNIRVCGEARPGKPWTIGVRDPFERERIVGIIRLSSGMAVATSGNYERYVMIDGKRYTHIIDPRTGFPVAGTAAVTTICPTAVAADAMSTALFVLGLEAGPDLLRRMKDCCALFVPDRRPLELWLTGGAADHFEPAAGVAGGVRSIR